MRLLILLMSLFSFSVIQSHESIYDIEIRDINGNIIDLNTFKGKKMLFVNVASACGFTPQYIQLEELQQRYKGSLIVIGVPCNQFGGQEPGTLEEIKSFCERNYNISFLLTEKILVKGKKKHPLYAWLTDKSKNGVVNSSVKWNFQKYLVNEQGELLNYFYSTTQPLSLKISKLIEQ